MFLYPVVHLLVLLSKEGLDRGALFPHFFLLVAETLNLYTVHCSQIKGIKMEDFTLTIGQLAVDTCLFLKNKDQVPVILQALKLFSDASVYQSITLKVKLWQYTA